VSELNFVFALGFLVSVAFAFYVGEHPELRADGRAGAHQTIQPQTNAGAEASLTAPSMKHHVTNDAAIDILKSYEGLALEAYPEAD